MATYDVSGHGLLSGEAAVLEGPVLTAHNDLAEDLLGLAGTSFSGSDLGKATRAVVLQVNFQVAAEGSAVTLSESRGRQSLTRRSTRSGEAFQVDAAAARLADQLLASRDWGTVRSVR